MAILVQMLIFWETRKNWEQLHTELVTECYWDSETVLGFSTNKILLRLY